MPRCQSTEDFLSAIDPELIQYSGLLITKGFSNTKLLAHLTFQDILELPIGHRRLLINEVSKIRSPHSKALLTALDANNLQGVLQPKELFPTCKTPKNAGTCAKDPKIESYTYMTPLQKHLNTLQCDIESKEHQMEMVKTEIDSFNERNTYDDNDTRPHCSICHEIGHRRNRCAGQKCVASVSCGKLRLHKDEIKKVDALKANLKKLVKEKLVLDSESEKISDKISQHNTSFAQAIRGHLINSNKHKYLTTYSDQIVPLTKVINLDISVLQKHYNNRVPSNLAEESQFFDGILQLHNDKVQKPGPTIASKLSESLSALEPRIDLSFPPSTSFNNVENTNPFPPRLQTPHLMPTRMSDTTVPHIHPPPYQRAPHNFQFHDPGYPQVDHKFDEDVSDLSRQFDHLQSPPRKMPKTTHSNYPKQSAHSGTHSFNTNPMQDWYMYNPNVRSTLKLPPWHQPDYSKKSQSLPVPYINDRRTETITSLSVQSGATLTGSGESPPLSAPLDYSVVYDQFNLKPKTALANRYTSETNASKQLNEPDLD